MRKNFPAYLLLFGIHKIFKYVSFENEFQNKKQFFKETHCYQSNFQRKKGNIDWHQ